MKKTLTKDQEFDIMKMVLDKFLWIGTIILLFGLFKIFQGVDAIRAIAVMIGGVVVLLLFIILLFKEFELKRK